MSKRPPRDFLMMNIAKADSRQVLLAKYLRDTGKIASQLMGAADAFYYSYALATDPSVSDAEVELAASESVLALSSQINRVLNFHRIDRQIILPNEFLSQCGLVWGSSPSSQAVIPQPRAVVNLPSPPQVNVATPETLQQAVTSSSSDLKNGNDDSKGLIVGGARVSQSVSDFLNGK
jgi:uncharacterized membrane protein